MLKCLTVLLLSLCTLCAAAQPEAGPSAKEQKALQKEHKALQKAQRKKLRGEILHFESLRNDAVIKFAKEHQPTDIYTPAFHNDFRISNVICAGDITTGAVMLHFDITPLFGGFRLYMGGERNGTCAYAMGITYPSSNQYGRIYSMHGGQPEHVVVIFYNMAQDVNMLDRVDISMGLSISALNIITMRNVPVFWTYSNKIIKNYVQENATKDTLTNQN